MKTLIGDDVGIVRVPHPRAPFSLSTNNNNPMVVTLRNTYYLLDNLDKAQGSGSGNIPGGVSKGKWDAILKGIKIGAITLGGLALFGAASSAMAGTHERDEEEELERRKELEAEKTGPAADKQEVSKASGLTEKDVIEDQQTTENPDKLAAESVDLHKPESKKESKPESKKVNTETKAELKKAKVQDKSLVGGKRSVANESVDAAIERAAKDSGEDVTWLRAMIHLESKGDPRAKSGQYLGLGQMGKSAWSDVQRERGVAQFPDLTGGPDDPRYDPYTNALATATLMGQNRKAIQSAAKEAGYEKVTLGLIYAAHNVGATTVKKMLRESDSSKWDEKTKGYINNQATELKQGGVGNYLKNTEQSMGKHYASANINVGAKQVAVANDLGVMSSVKPVQLANRTQESVPSATKQAVINVPVQVAQAPDNSAPVKSRAPKPQQQEPAQQVAQQESQQGEPEASDSGAYTGEPRLFRQRNGKMAVI